MIINGYEVGALFHETPTARMYTGTRLSDGREVILKVSRSVRNNYDLKEDVKRISTISEAIKFVSEHYPSQDNCARLERAVAHPEGYFSEPRQFDHLVSVWTLSEVIKLDELVPLGRLLNDAEVDARTMAWIMLDILVLYRAMDIYKCHNQLWPNFPLPSLDNFLVGPEHHWLVFFDNIYGIYPTWDTNRLPKVFCETLQKSIGDTRPDGPTEDEAEFRAALDRLGEENKRGFIGLKEEYEMKVSRLWDYWVFEYYPFTFRQRDSDRWQTIRRRERLL